MHKRGESYYYVTNGPQREWIPLGRDLAVARLLWADLEGNPHARTVDELVARFLAIPTARKDGTRKQYKTWANAVCARFGSRSVEAVTMHEVAEWRDSLADRPAWVNGCLTILSLAFTKAQEWGWCNHNPTPKRLEPRRRTRRLTHAEFRAIRNLSPQWLQDAMDLAYLTSSRESDVTALTWAQIGVELEVRQIKTDTPQEYEINEALASIIARCKTRRVLGLYVIADMHGKRITESRLQRNYKKARIAAGIEDTTFHDIRALAASDAKRAGLDYQALLGHASRKQSDAYLRGIHPIKAVPNKSVL